MNGYYGCNRTVTMDVIDGRTGCRSSQAARLLIVFLLTGCSEQCQCPAFWEAPPIPFPTGFEPLPLECPQPDPPCDSIDTGNGTPHPQYHPVGTPSDCCVPAPEVFGDTGYDLPVLTPDPNDPVHGCPEWTGHCLAHDGDTDWNCYYRDEYLPASSSGAASPSKSGGVITYGPANNAIAGCDPKKSTNCKPM